MRRPSISDVLSIIGGYRVVVEAIGTPGIIKVGCAAEKLGDPGKGNNVAGFPVSQKIFIWHVSQTRCFRMCGTAFFCSFIIPVSVGVCPYHIEFQIVFHAVEIDVDHCFAVGGHRLVHDGVYGGDREAGVGVRLLTVEDPLDATQLFPVHDGVVQIAFLVCDNGLACDGVAHIAFEREGFREVIAVSSHILPPNDNRIVSLLFGHPFGVDNGVLIEVAFEHKGSVESGVGVPTAEVIAVSGRGVGLGFRQCVAGGADVVRFKEFRGSVAGAFAVFVEYQPIAVGQLLHKGDRTLDFDGGSVRVDVVRQCSFHNVGVALPEVPALEIGIGFGGDIRFVDNVVLHGIVVEEVKHLVNANDDIGVAQASVVDGVGLQQHGVEHHGVAQVFGDFLAVFEAVIDELAHHIDGHTALGGRGVIPALRPSEEIRSLGDVTRVGRIHETGHEFAVVDGVGAFHQHAEGVV